VQWAARVQAEHRRGNCYQQDQHRVRSRLVEGRAGLRCDLCGSGSSCHSKKKGNADLVFGFELDSIIVDGVDGRFSIAVRFRVETGGGAFVWRCLAIIRLGRGEALPRGILKNLSNRQPKGSRGSCNGAEFETNPRHGTVDTTPGRRRRVSLDGRSKTSTFTPVQILTTTTTLHSFPPSGKI